MAAKSNPRREIHRSTIAGVTYWCMAGGTLALRCGSEQPSVVAGLRKAVYAAVRDMLSRELTIDLANNNQPASET